MLNEEARRKDKEAISELKALITEGDMKRGRARNWSWTLELRKVEDRVKVKGKAHVLLLWEVGALPEEIQTLLKGQRGSRRCQLKEEFGSEMHVGFCDK